MAKTNEAVFTQNANIARATIVNADGTTAKTLITAGADDTKITGIALTTDDTAAVNVQVIHNDGSNDTVIGIVNVPITSGFAASTSGVDGFNATDLPQLPKNSAGNPYIMLKTGHSLKVAALAAVTSAKTLYAVALGEDF